MPAWTGIAAGKLSACFLLGLLCAGCAGVVPVSKRTVSPQGPQKEAMDLSFLRAGQTNRQEVIEKLKPFDTGYRSDRFFLARRAFSSKYEFGFIGGPGAVVGATGRDWDNATLLVEFDDKGIVRHAEVFPDDDLVSKLGPVAADRKASGSGRRAELLVTSLSRHEYKIVLTPGSFEYVELKARKKPMHFTIDAAKIRGIRSVLSADPEPVYTYEHIQFTESLKPLGGPSGKELLVGTTVPDLVVLLNFLATNGWR